MIWKTMFLGIFSLSVNFVFSQEMDAGIYYGRFYSPYRFVDYGVGAKNNPRANYNFFPSLAINKYYSEKISIEAGVSFTLYEQYYSTRKYIAAFESTYGAGHITLRAAYSFLKGKKIECRIKGGLGIGIAPDMYEGEYVEIFIYPYVDSISRGFIKRNFTPIFPMLSSGLEFSYKVAKEFKISLSANYQKGFIRITEYDIYYNDGSGSNDQRAKQWGTGDFYGMQLGLRYLLKDENGRKFGNKRNK